MTLENFWDIIEASWEDSPELNEQRHEAITHNDEELLVELSVALERVITENYNRQLS